MVPRMPLPPPPQLSAQRVGRPGMTVWLTACLLASPPSLLVAATVSAKALT